MFTKALRRKDMAGSSAKTEDAASDEPEAPPQSKKDEKKELADLEEELEKASSGKILNLISVDTYRRELSWWRFRQSRRPDARLRS